MKKIPLTQGKFALVDDADFERLNQWKWFFHHGYAARQSKKENGKQHAIWMHREILNTPDGMDTDHIDTNKLNNQKYNLRVSTRSQNKANGRLQKNNKSGYKGVTFQKADNKWVANIKIMGNRIYLGIFLKPEDAAKAYDDKAIELFGEFALLNFPVWVKK